jgi:hypothetical protein
VHGGAVGLIVGLGFFGAPNWLVLKGGQGDALQLVMLGQMLFGYDVSFLGSLVGLAYGFGGGFTMGYFVCSMYNWVAVYRERTSRALGR